MNDEQVHIKICEPNFELALAKCEGPLRDPVDMNSRSMIIKYTHTHKKIALQYIKMGFKWSG